MRSLKITSKIKAVSLGLWFAATPSWAKTSPQTEIHITLLGQPCLLQGPFDEPTLKGIHTIGPAQLYTDITPLDSKNSNKEAHKALEKIRSANSLPSLLDHYKEKAGKRLEAQIALLDCIEKPHPTPSLLLKVGKRYLKSRNIQNFEKIANKLATPKKNSPQYRDLVEQLFDIYNAGIEPDPEEEFHRVIKKMGVEYVCSFDETEEGGGAE